MSTAHAKLLAGMYKFPKKQLSSVTDSLQVEHIQALNEAITEFMLPGTQGTQRHAVVICRYYGINCQPTTLCTIGSTLRKPVCTTRVGHIRGQAEEQLRKNKKLRPILAHLVDNGLVGQADLLDQTFDLISSEQRQSLQELTEKGLHEGPWKTVKVSAVGFSTRILNALNQLSINTLGELVQKSESDFRLVVQFSEKSLTELQKKLAECGLSLAEE